MKKITSALISVYNKDGLEEIVRQLDALKIEIFSTGGTYDFITGLGIKAKTVESLTSYPSILGGRVKTLHPKIFGGILARRDHQNDMDQLAQYHIPEIDLVIVDLYPFEKTVASTKDADEIIEKIDIGGIALIRAAAKNYEDLIIVPSTDYYEELRKLLTEKRGFSDLHDRKFFATLAFHVSSHYDTAIFNYFRTGEENVFKSSIGISNVLRYGENPHQQGIFYGHLEEIFVQLHGKAISYNNIGDLDAGIHLIGEFTEPTFAILKHNNACGIASRSNVLQAYKDALAGDPVSAFGGVLITNTKLDNETAGVVNDLFFEIIIAPEYEEKGLEILKSKKNRIILKMKSYRYPARQFRSALNGVLEQDRDLHTEAITDFKTVTKLSPNKYEKEDLLFANKVVKHTKSNAIVLVRNKQLCASGTGQTSRIDALKQSIAKANEYGFNLHGAVMASDAFFPFADSVELAHKAGITAVIQPGGSVRDQESVDYCDKHQMSMVFTGIRHFKH